MSQLATAKQILTALEQAMLTNVGVKSVTVGDQTIAFDSKKDLVGLIDYYEKMIGSPA